MPLFPSQGSVSNHCISFEYLYKKFFHFWKKRGMGGMPSLAPAHSRPAADQPWPAPRAAPPTAGWRWKWAPAQMRNLGELRARQCCRELNFKMSSIYYLWLARAAAWAVCRSGEHPAGLAAVVSLLPDHVQASASASLNLPVLCWETFSG